MSLLPALDDSENSVSHGWTNSRFGMDPTQQAQDGSSNIYHHLINQNNAGTVPDAVVEEEVIPPNGPVQGCQTDFNQGNQMMPQHRFPADQVQQHAVNQTHAQQLLNRPQMHHQQGHHQQFHPKQQQQQPPPSLHSSKQLINHQQPPAKKVVYTVIQQDGQKQGIEMPQEHFSSFVKFQSGLPNVPQQHHQQHQQQNNVVQPTKNGNPGQQYPGNNAEALLDRALKAQEQKIAENNKMLAAYKQLGFQAASGNGSPSSQVSTSVSTGLSSNNPDYGMKNMNHLNSTPSLPKSIDIKMADNNGATNQVKSLLQLNPAGIVNKSPVVTLHGQRPNTYVQQGFIPQNIQSPISNNPVQVSSISSNQIPPTSGSSGVMNKINKNNVVLEGGGQFEEGQAYVIRDKHGRQQTMVWKNGDFVLVESNESIQHQVVDSSQRGRGSRGRGSRGRGRGRGQVQVQVNTSGIMPSSPRGSPRGMRSPVQRFARPPHVTRGQSNDVRKNLQHQINHPMNRTPQHTLIIRTPSPSTSHPNLSPNVTGSSGLVMSTGQQTPILSNITLKNLMPPAQGSQKTAPPSGTNLAREYMNHEEKEEPDKDLSQMMNTSTSTDSQCEKTEVLDPPRIPYDVNAVAVCQFCGYVSEDKVKCESCKRNFTSATKYQIKGTGVPINTEGLNVKKRKIDPSTGVVTGGVTKRTFYGKNNEQQQQNQFYTQVIHSANGPMAVTRNPRIITRSSGRPRGRGRGRGRGIIIPETITLSSDEEEGESSQKGLGDVNNSSQSSTPSRVDQSSQECPESPLIPIIPITSKPSYTSRMDKMEDEAGLSRKDREGSCSPVNVVLNAKSVTVGTFRGIPLEPIVLCKSGLRFFVEGKQGSHRFLIYPSEIQQCLSHLSERNSSYLFFLVNQGCGTRTRQDLGIRHHTDPKIPPPEPYFDPFGADLTHQMIMVLIEKIEATVIVEFQKYMDMFKSWGRAGDEAFFMELSEQEADEVRKQSLKKIVVPQVGIVSQSMIPDHQYSQHGEEDKRSRSPTPPQIGFVGPVIKLLTYPPPPEKRGISITNADLYCLQEGEFLNDVIIDFYLKYLHMEKLSERDKERTHIFSSFFYKRLTQRIRGAAIDDDPNLALPEKRHARVKTWTRHVDLFKKDFIVIPINEHAHWFLAIICYPWLMEPVQNKYIPNRPNTPGLDSLNVPTPPQPTDDNTEDMDAEENSENPLANKKPESTDSPAPSEITNSQSTETEPISQPTEDSLGTPGESDKTDKVTATGVNTSQQEHAEDEQKDKTTEESSKTDSEAKDVSDKSKESKDKEEVKEDRVDTPPQDTPVLPKSAVYPKMTAVRPIRGQCLEDSETKNDDVLTGIKQPCVLIFDSLSGPSRSRIVTVLKEYLQVEWRVKKETEAERVLNKGIFRGCVPKVPQQNNYSDCGVFMLQYVESFFEDPIQDFATPMKGLYDWFPVERIGGKREELRDLIISLKEKYENKSEAGDNT